MTIYQVGRKNICFYKKNYFVFGPTGDAHPPSNKPQHKNTDNIVLNTFNILYISFTYFIYP